MKKRTVKHSRHHVPKPPRHNHHHMLPIAIAILIILITLVMVSQFGDFAATGQASKLKLSLFDLDANKSATIDITKVGAFDVSMTLSASQKKKGAKPVTFKITHSKKKNGMVEVNLVSTSQIISSQALLSDKLVEPLSFYLDEDAKPDLHVEYAKNKLTVRNGNFFVPQVANVTVFDSTLKVLSKKTFSADKGKESVYYFNISSTKTPVIGAFWKADGKFTKLTKKQFIFNSSDDTSLLMELRWTPKEDKVYTLVLKTKVDDKLGKEEFRFAVGNIVYFLDDPNHPKVVMRKKDANTYDVELTFRSTRAEQAFSLPCGSFDLDKFSASGKIKTVRAWDGKSVGWKKGVPSEFTTLEAGKGYLLSMRKSESVTLKTTCTLKNSDFFTFSSLPSVGLGYNLIGVKGDKSIAVSKLHVPAGKLVNDLTLLNNKGFKSDPQDFEPGKAYWVNIK